MSDAMCPFCGRDPFHYVDNGVGMEAVAVTCCNLGDAYFRGMRPEPETVEMDWGEFRKIGHRLADQKAAQEAAYMRGWSDCEADIRSTDGRPAPVKNEAG